MKFGKAIMVASLCAALSPALTQAQTPPKVVIGMNGWIGFAPLHLALREGLFKKNGVHVEIRMMPLRERRAALASDVIQCAAANLETHVAWTANGVPSTQILLLDQSNGGDGLAVRKDIAQIKGLAGQRIGVDVPGTSPHFMLAYLLKKNGMTLSDVTLVSLAPQAAVEALLAGQVDAAQLYEPHLSTVRDHPERGKVLLSTRDYPAVLGSLACRRDFLRQQPKLARALVRSWFEALDMIHASPARAHQVMGAATGQSGAQSVYSASFIHWQGRRENRAFFDQKFGPFSREVGEILLSSRLIAGLPDPDSLYEGGFLH